MLKHLSIQTVQSYDIEYQALISNNNLTFSTLPVYKKSVDWKWVFKVKLNLDGTEERKKAWLAAKDFTQQAGLDCEEMFLPVVKLVTVKTLLAVVAQK